MRTTQIRKLIKLIVLKESNREKYFHCSLVCVPLKFFTVEINFIKMLNSEMDKMVELVLKMISQNCLFSDVIP